MREYFPLLFVGAVIGVFSIIFAVAYAMMKDKKTAIGFERNMKDGEIIRRLLKYARPYVWNFVLVGVVMLLSISYDILSPLIISDIEELITSEFEMKDILIRVGVYASILIVSLVSMYVQAIVLQKTGQKIISALR